MPHAPTEHEGRDALRGHIVSKASEARLRYGPTIDADAIFRMLDDRSVVRFPVGVRFESAALEPGEPAFPMPLGDRPGESYCLFVHPVLGARPDLLPLVIAYYLPSINYGEIVTHEEAELFGATLLGLEPDTYYQAMCEIADALPAPARPEGDPD